MISAVVALKKIIVRNNADWVILQSSKCPVNLSSLPLSNKLLSYARLFADISKRLMKTSACCYMFFSLTYNTKTLEINQLK